MALQFGITAIGTIMVQSVLNLFGAIAVAAFTAANKVVNIATQPFMAIGMTMATYCAQNKGINALDRIKKGVVISNLLCVGYSIVAMVVINFIMPFALTLFVSGDTTDILSFAKAYTLITSIFYIPLAMIFIFRNALQGSGYAFVPMMGGVVELVSRVIIAKIGRASCWGGGEARL